MEMKTQTLVSKLEEKHRRPGHVVSMGEINLAINILKMAKNQAPKVYEKIKSLIP